MRHLLLTAALAAGVALAGCESSEERAEEHFEKGSELLKEGDVARALVEFRNVFKLDGRHKGARLAYAGAVEKRGRIRDAYGQYLRLVEQYPENLEGQRALARLGMKIGDWGEAKRHHDAAAEIAPDDPVVRAVGAGLDYRAALQDEDPEARKAAVAEAEKLLSADPGLSGARRVVIDDRLRNENWQGALAAIDGGLDHRPDARRLHTMRLGVLQKLGRDDAIEAQLRDMIERFPDDEGVHATLLRWYVSHGELDAAEAYLRGRIEEDDSDPAARTELVRFLAANRGRDAARDELETLIEAGGANTPLFRSMRAGLEFDAGERQQAISEMEAILDTAEPSDQTRRIKVALARMRIATGSPVGARKLVEEVLEADPGQVAALKLKANWLIDDDRPGDALVTLRGALDQAPRDAEVMTLMARAHDRAGDRQLTGEMLSRAVEASQSAPGPSQRYAAYLVQEGKLDTAGSVLRDALRLQPGNVQLLRALGEIYAREQAWPRLDGVTARLNELDGKAARNAANELTAQKLSGQNRQGELTSFLEGLAESGEAGLSARVAILRQRLADGDREGALAYARKLLEEKPDAPARRFILATMLAINGETEKAEKGYRQLTENHPGNQRVWLALYNLERSLGRKEKAASVLDEALDALPGNPTLRLMHAAALEREGEIDEAIAIYEDLYAENSNSAVVANNLASLISSYRESDESLERAYDIARRLRDTRRPEFQDTYGWIAHRLGNDEEAVGYLAPAARALPGKAVVQYHLAAVYDALGRTADALATYRKATAAASGNGPWHDEAEAAIARLEEAAAQDAAAAEDAATQGAATGDAAQTE